MKIGKKSLVLFLTILLLLSLHGTADAAGKRIITSVEVRRNGSAAWLYNKDTGKRITGLTGIHQLPAKSGHYYYFRSSKGQIYASGWFQNAKGFLYADRKGRLKTGLQKISGKYYYFHPKTHVRMYGWQTIGRNRYYFQPDGTMKTGLFSQDGALYYLDPRDGHMHVGWVKAGGNTYFMSRSANRMGQALTGWQTINKKRYYFQPTGVMHTGWMIMDKYCLFFDGSGVYQRSQSANPNRGSDEFGTAQQKTIRRAEAIVAYITNDQMTKEQKLWTCFQYVMYHFNGSTPRTPNYCGMDWPVVYANDMFLDGSGNCFSYASAFGYMAKACGYTEVYVCNSTGHGWAEINGLIYDPEEYKTANRKWYGVSYDEIPRFRTALNLGLPFMHMKL